MTQAMDRQAMLDYCTPEDLVDMVLAERERADAAEIERDDHEIARTVLEEVLGQAIQERSALAQVARYAFRSAASGLDVSGAEIQALGVELGLLRAETYDPDRHGRAMLDDLEPGVDVVYVESEVVRQREEVWA